jgi:hypothetical protein
VVVVVFQLLGPLGLKVFKGTVAELGPITIIDMSHGSLKSILLSVVIGCGCLIRRII